MTIKNQIIKNTEIYPLNQRWREGPRSLQKIVLISNNQKKIVKNKDKGKHFRKKVLKASRFK